MRKRHLPLAAVALVAIGLALTFPVAMLMPALRPYLPAPVFMILACSSNLLTGVALWLRLKWAPIIYGLFFIAQYGLIHTAGLPVREPNGLVGIFVVSVVCIVYWKEMGWKPNSISQRLPRADA